MKKLNLTLLEIFYYIFSSFEAEKLVFPEEERKKLQKKIKSN